MYVQSDFVRLYDLIYLTWNERLQQQNMKIVWMIQIIKNAACCLYGPG